MVWMAVTVTVGAGVAVIRQEQGLLMRSEAYAAMYEGIGKGWRLRSTLGAVTVLPFVVSGICCHLMCSGEKKRGMYGWGFKERGHLTWIQSQLQ